MKKALTKALLAATRMVNGKPTDPAAVQLIEEQEKYRKLLKEAQSAWLRKEWAKAVSTWRAAITAYDTIGVPDNEDTRAWRAEMELNLAKCRRRHGRKSLGKEGY